MTFAERTALHVTILQVLRTKAELGMPEPALQGALTRLGQDYALPALQAELRALANSNHVTPLKLADGTRYRITPFGEAHLTEAGL